MQMIDTHCHIDVAEFDADRDQVLAECRAKGVARLIVPAIESAGWEKLLYICQQCSDLCATLGLHPVYLEQHKDSDLQALERKLGVTSGVVAVGEIGLDFYLADLDQKRQIQLFDAQLAIARVADLPVILHVRKAHQQTLALLKNTKVRGGIVHAFNGSLEQARQYQDLGFKFGFGGMISYERSRKLRSLAAELPLESIVLETDAPDMAGAICQGQRNSPQFLPAYLKALAEIRGLPVEEVAAQTTKNAMEIFALA